MVVTVARAAAEIVTHDFDTHCSKSVSMVAFIAVDFTAVDQVERNVHQDGGCSCSEGAGLNAVVTVDIAERTLRNGTNRHANRSNRCYFTFHH